VRDACSRPLPRVEAYQLQKRQEQEESDALRNGGTPPVLLPAPPSRPRHSIARTGSSQARRFVRAPIAARAVSR
jgi:hypothetical protein